MPITRLGAVHHRERRAGDSDGPTGPGDPKTYFKGVRESATGARALRFNSPYPARAARGLSVTGTS